MATGRNNDWGSGRFDTFSSGVFLLFFPSFTNKKRRGGGKKENQILSFFFPPLKKEKEKVREKSWFLFSGKKIDNGQTETVDDDVKYVKVT